MKRTLLALMLVLSLTSLAGCGNNNTVTDKDTANNNPTSNGYQADEDGSVTSNGKTDTTDKTTTTTTKVDKTDEETFQDVKNILVPSTSDVLYGLIDGSVVSSTWNTLTGKTDQLFSYVLRRTGDSVGGTLGDFLNYLGEGATYVCYSGGKQVAYSTATKYPVIAGGIAIGRSADGKAINRMLQLSPVVIDKLGAASVMSGDKRYETADDMQVYLWSNGQYFATSLPKINTEDYKLIGWYDNFGCSGGRKIRILVAVKTN